MEPRAARPTGRPFIGIALIIGAMLLFACQDAMTRTLSNDYPAPMIVMVRFWVMAISALAFLYLRHVSVRQSLMTPHPGLQVLRCLVLVIEVWCFVLAVRTLSLAEVHALLATFPLMATAMSIPLLGERVGRRRWAAILAGFAGVLVILRPGYGIFGPGAVYGLITAALFALYNVLTRLVHRTDSIETSFAYFAFVGMAASSAVGAVFWMPPDGTDWLLMLGIGVTSSFGHLMLILALSMAAAATLQPFNYTLLAWAILVGYLVFGDLPDLATLTGAAIVVASGLYTLYREHVRWSREADDLVQARTRSPRSCPCGRTPPSHMS